MATPRSGTGSTQTANVVPHNLDAEQTTLGALMIDPERFYDIQATIRPTDFHDPVNRAIYEAIIRLHEARQPIDFLTVANAVQDDPILATVGGSAYLAQLCESVPTASYAQHYAAIVRDRSVQRALADAGRTITQIALDPQTPIGEAVEIAEQRILALSRTTANNRPQHIAVIGAQSYERYAELHEAEDKQALFGMRTGFADLDHLLAGLQPGNLMIVAARPSMGKTSFALDVARHAAAVQRKKVTVFSLEMAKQELMDRIIAGFLGIETWKLKKDKLSPEEFVRLGKLFDGLKEHPLYIDDDPDTTIANLRSKARRQQIEYGLDLLVIDYLQLIEVTDRASGENRTQQVSHISRSLKNLARELGCPIIALSQLSRSVEQRNPPIPILSDLRESGSIEQDADSVVMLYREGAYNEDCENPLATDLYVRKNRNGPTGRVELHFDAGRMTFLSVDRHSSTAS